MQRLKGLPGATGNSVTGRKGPTPGAIAVTPLGVNVDLSQLTVPGLCVIKNLAAAGTSDYVLYSFRLTDARTSRIVWEDVAEIKKQGLEDAAYR